MSTSQKIIYFVIAGLFFLFAIVQWNDPDPLIWILFYDVMSLIYILLAIKNKFAFYLAIVMSIICLVSMAVILPEIFQWMKDGMPSIVQSMKAEIPTIEYTREFLGLLLCLIACIWVIRVHKTTIINN
ncbi:MAG: transmembrane 220 family protein [Saprospiraceae bacterium]